MQKILSQLRKAITDFNMINDGDKIAVGLSGGKDSITLATALKMYQRFSPEKFELKAIIVDLFNGKTDYSTLLDYCRGIDLDVVVVPSEIYDVVFNIRKEKNPCSLCAKLRRGILNSKAKELGFNKVALGHHSDDLVETFLLSLFYEGRLSTFSPVTYLSNTQLTVIRPMMYVSEQNVLRVSSSMPIIHNCCPADKHTQRQYVKDLLSSIDTDVPDVKQRILDALVHPERNKLITK